MKKIHLLLAIAPAIIFSLSSCGDSKHHIRGNGNVITKQIQIADYDEIKINAPVTLDYSQVDGVPFFEISTDDNVLDYLYINVIGRTLYIEPTRNPGQRGRYCNLDPTMLKITTNSRRLREIDNDGSGYVSVISPISGFELEIDINGSGSIVCYDSINVNELSIDISGSGDFVNYAPTFAHSLDVDISGSGEIELKGGEVNFGEVDVQGSGKLHALPVIFQTLDCEISGSGSSYTTIIERLTYKISGSGKIYYRGNPIIQGKVSGSGEIINIP
ncbi:DUF2807 domain-containing protein [Bacteroidales bacterium OttesenSCG-928-B11]|nr:DUF2807 domain-containing protein [Bacteroidales bacterium OttesenSCG-928-B11]MDL2325920.1 DUF2807 domain-containing protein [Bacteroidales bacterium OttesenSCG-928-A14]